ncbi:MAG: hypothetical protein AAFX99_19135 [Myxococcota bacterium]
MDTDDKNVDARTPPDQGVGSSSCTTSGEPVETMSVVSDILSAAHISGCTL